MEYNRLNKKLFTYMCVCDFFFNAYFKILDVKFYILYSFL